jgi:hypothetical protein
LGAANTVLAVCEVRDKEIVPELVIGLPLTDNIELGAESPTLVTVPPEEGLVLVIVVVPLEVATEIPVPPTINWALLVSPLILATPLPPVLGYFAYSDILFLT